jgi:hypothetical protein
MTTQATNRKEGGSTSCSGRSRKLRTYTEKELETVCMAPELLGAPTIGGGSARSGGRGRGGLRSQISLPSHPKYTKTVKKRAVSLTFLLINHQKRSYLLKNTYQDILTRRFLRNMSIFITT